MRRPKYRASPKHVYHYTTLDTLISIVRDRELWMSDIATMNDAKDGTYIVDLLKTVASNLKALPQYAGNDRAEAYLRYVDENARLTIGGIFLCCFSKDFDSLSQWRAYGSSAPCCLAFDAEELSASVRDILIKIPGRSIYAGEVTYGGLDHFTQLIQARLDAILSVAPHPNHRSALDEMQNPTDWIQLDIMQRVDEVAKYKAKSFTDEKEFRIASLVGLETVEAPTGPEPCAYIKFVPRHSYVRKVMAVRFGEQFKKMIKAVKVGPGPSASLSAQTVGEMLDFYKFQSDSSDDSSNRLQVPVDTSETPYRNW